MCRTGQYTERGIKGRHGYASERYRIRPEFAVKIDPGLDRFGVLLEPTSVVAKHGNRWNASANGPGGNRPGWS